MSDGSTYYSLWQKAKYVPCISCAAMITRQLTIITKDGYMCFKCKRKELEDLEEHRYGKRRDDGPTHPELHLD